MGFEWEVPPEQAFAQLYDEYARNIIQGITRLAKAYTAEIEAWLKSNAPFQDRTGNLRQSFYADVETALYDIVLFFDYGLEYGKYVEYVGQGKYASIAPALDYFAPKFWADVKKLVEAK